MQNLDNWTNQELGAVMEGRNTVAWRGSPIIFDFVDFLTPTDTLGCMLIPLGVSSILKDFNKVGRGK